MRSLLLTPHQILTLLAIFFLNCFLGSVSKDEKTKDFSLALFWFLFVLLVTVLWEKRKVEKDDEKVINPGFSMTTTSPVLKRTSQQSSSPTPIKARVSGSNFEFNQRIIGGWTTTTDFEKSSSPRKQKVFAMDCEMCDVKEGPAYLSTFKFPIHVSIVDEDLNLVYNEYICPDSNLLIVNDVAWIHGVTEQTFRTHGISFNRVREEIHQVLRGHVVTGHDLKSDFRALNIQGLIPEDNVRDTARTPLFMRTNAKNGHLEPKSLPDLAWERLGIRMRKASKGKHDPVEDAQVSMLLYMALKDDHCWAHSLHPRRLFA